MRLFQTRLVTTDVPGLTRFYRELTNTNPVGGDDYVEFATIGGGFAICSKHSVDMFSAAAATAGANLSVILDFQVDDVDKERSRLTGLVKAFVLEPTNQPWGNRSMLFRDPDGNLINFFAPLANKDEIDQQRKSQTVRKGAEQ
jgi:catechol 2,3-dioxygenase-like lactoylglutathione lyase family enzyme